MKNSKIFFLFLIQLLVVQLAVSQNQSFDENGRPVSTTPKAIVNEQQAPPISADNLNEIDDADIPGTYYLRGGNNDVLIGQQDPVNLMDRLDNLEAELIQLRLYNEQLALENQTIKREMSNCCSEAAANLNVSRSFLLQNSPNPFQEDTRIQFYVEESANDATLEIRNIQGILLKSIDLEKKGLGEFTVDSSTFQQGTYVYTLSVDGEIIDSKVMILQ